MKFKGYYIYISDKPNKKYYALVKNKKIYFGDSKYQHYKDKLGFYKYLDHNDKDRKKRYYLRHPKDYPKGSADWFSKKILW
jgi:hypothetical protein